MSQLAFVPDPPADVKLDNPVAPAAEGICDLGYFDINVCGTKQTHGNGDVLPEGVKQGVTLSPNVTDIVSLFYKQISTCCMLNYMFTVQDNMHTCDQFVKFDMYYCLSLTLNYTCM